MPCRNIICKCKICMYKSSCGSSNKHTYDMRTAPHIHEIIRLNVCTVTSFSWVFLHVYLCTVTSFSWASCRHTDDGWRRFQRVVQGQAVSLLPADVTRHRALPPDGRVPCATATGRGFRSVVHVASAVETYYDVSYVCVVILSTEYCDVGLVRPWL